MIRYIRSSGVSRVLFGNDDEVMESVRRKITEIWRDKWSFHHYNALAHDALRICEFRLKVTKIDHQSYQLL
jgi:uncharacterized protein YjlB